ncbi:MAG: glycosyltransferase [Selenomonadaceae bacterium]|nr:glycosyltransferase [Selenomonadaceae bacterium]
MTFESMIPPRSKTVLEVTGEVAEDFQTTEENYLLIQPECKYTVTKNLNDAEGNFDAILLQSELIGNIPKTELVALIKDAAKKLNPKGTLVFALDNIAFADNILAILQSQPPKFKVTLTKAELSDAIKEAGVTEYRSLNASRRANVPQQLRELSKNEPLIFKYIVIATADEMPPQYLIQSIIGEKLVCAPIRIHRPNMFLTTEPNIFTSSVTSDQPYRIFPKEQYENRIMINQRVTFPTFTNGVKFFETMKSQNYLFIEEMDDHPVLWEESYKKTAYINFIGVHAIQTSTEYLAEYLRQFNPHVKVFANHLQKLLPPRDFDAEFAKEDRPTTIFFGALNRDKEFNEILPVLNDFAKKYGKKLQFKILARKNLFEDLQSENKVMIGDTRIYEAQFVPYERYEHELATSDIALLPLQDNKFNRGKSDLKFLECAACGVAALVSPVVYSEVVKDGENGFIFYDNSDFAKKLETLIENRDKRREIVTAAYEYVKHNRLMSQHYEERLDWYKELFAKLPELTEEAQARIDKEAPRFKDEKPVETVQRPAGNSNRTAEIIIPV